MNKIFVVLGILLLVSLASARPWTPLIEKYDQTTCWSDYAFNLVDYVDAEYWSPPAYLEAYADQLNTAMIELFNYADTDDMTGFMGKLSEVMNLVRKIQASFWRESINYIVSDPRSVGGIASDYADMVDGLNLCLEGPI